MNSSTDVSGRSSSQLSKKVTLRQHVNNCNAFQDIQLHTTSTRRRLQYIPSHENWLHYINTQTTACCRCTCTCTASFCLFCAILIKTTCLYPLSIFIWYHTCSTILVHVTYCTYCIAIGFFVYAAYMYTCTNSCRVCTSLCLLYVHVLVRQTVLCFATWYVKLYIHVQFCTHRPFCLSISKTARKFIARKKFRVQLYGVD